MLDLVMYIDDINIYNSTVDSWGIPTKDNSFITVKGRIKPVMEYIEMQNQKNKSTVVTCAISVPPTTSISLADKVGIFIDGDEKILEVLRITPVRDLGGNILYKKVMA